MQDFDPAIALNTDDPRASDARPDIVALLGPRFDQPRGEPAEKTLIICAAPRTGSYELARFLVAAGIGVPHEYFNPTCAAAIAARWQLQGDVLTERLDFYIDELRRRRAPGSVFAVKLQYWQYEDTLANAHGRALFENAVVVHLFRADVVSQFVSWHKACESGRFDFTEKVTHPPRDPAALYRSEGLLPMLDQLVTDDANFRRLFMFAGITPIFLEFETLCRDPQAVVATIAAALDVPFDKKRLAAAISDSAPYPNDRDVERRKKLTHLLRAFAFRK